MLSVWKLRVGAEDYYLEQVAKGFEDYYSGAGETAGEWLGNGSGALGLGDDVVGDELRAVLAGLAPGTGLTPNGDQIRPYKNRVPGFDLTFSAPKSVSVLYALSDPLVRAQVTEATDVAVAEAMSWLEREACFVRRGSNTHPTKNDAGEFEKWGTRRLPAKGFVAAQFRHRTSRHGDPQLHSHVLIANMAKGPDGRWTALDGQAIYKSKMAAGAVYQSVLRNELTKRLGVEWKTPKKGLSDIVGIPDQARKLFSKRRAEIETELARTGKSGPKASDTAALDTRETKENIDQKTLDQAWLDEAATIGYGPDDINDLLARSAPESAQIATASADTPLAADTLIAVQNFDSYKGAVVHEALTIDEFATRIGHKLPETDSIVNRHAVQNAVADQLGASGSTHLLERLTDAVLAHRELVPLPALTDDETPWEQRWTTRTLIDKEAELTALFTPDDSMSVGVVDPEIVARNLANLSTLGDDQADVVRRLTTQGLAVEAVVGKAGTGKTYTMNAVRQVFEDGGYEVVGACPTGRAARELTDGAGIEATTMHRFAFDQLHDKSVVVMDEAGMVGTFQFHQIATRARRAGAKIIVVGDHHQLPEIEAGGGFAALLEAVGDQRAELRVNRRQRHEWEHPALDHLRDGDLDLFWQAYLEHDRVVLGSDQADVQNRAVGDWFLAQRAGSNAHMLAGTRAEADLLNDLARQLVADSGQLRGDSFDINGSDFRVGERVLLTKNMPGQLDLDQHDETRVDNGMIGTITAYNGQRNEVDVELVNGRNIRLTSSYVNGGHLAYGYATTFHKAQGLTCDDVFVVGPNGMYREAGYVALSRAKNEAHLYATSKQAAAIGERTHSAGIPLPSEGANDAQADIIGTLSMSMAKQFATAHQPHLAVVADIAHEFTIGNLESRLGHINKVAARLRKQGHTDPSVAIERHTRATLHRSVMHVGGRVNALDRDNIGTVTNIADGVGHARVEFVSSDGTRSFHKLLPWENLRPVDSPPPAEMTPAATKYLTELDWQLTQELHDWEEALDDAGIDVSDYEMIPAALEQRRRQLVHQLRATPPAWLRYWTGDRPADPTGARVYDDHLTRLAQWRDTHQLTDDVAGYGPQPSDPVHAATWRTLLDEALDTRTWLEAHDPSVHAEPVQSIDLAAARDRIIELDALFASAPTDMRRVVEDLTNTIDTNTSPTVDTQLELLDAARAQQTERADWILEHWPNVVEYIDLQAIVEHAGPLDHWPDALDTDVQDLYNQLAATSVDTPEDRNLRTLDQAWLEAHPAHQAEQLDEVRHHVYREINNLAAETDPAGASVRRDQIDRLRERKGQLTDQIDRLKAKAMVAGWGDEPSPELGHAISQRSNHLAHAAITTNETWVTELIATRHDNDPDITADDLASLVADVAAYRERSGHTGDHPIGMPPDTTGLASDHSALVEQINAEPIGVELDWTIAD